MNEIRPESLTVADPRWELANRVADSVHFRKSPKLRGFLLYVCENAILGRIDNVREQLIGSQVFGRPLDYSIYEDNIVRVEARELRKRLEAYFGGDGSREPLMIEIPRGTYVPVFRRREEPAPQPAGEAPSPPSPPQVATPSRPSRLPRLLGAGLALALAAVAALIFENRRLQLPPAPAGSGVIGSAEDIAMYSDLLGQMGSGAKREPQLVLSNPQVFILYGAEPADPPPDPERAAPVPPELAAHFAFALPPKDRSLPRHLLSANREGYTGIGEAVAAFYLGRLMQSMRRPVRLTQSRFLNWDQVQRQDLILVGGPSSNNWSFQNDSKSNFVFAERRGIQNLRPMAGERKEYGHESAVGGKAEIDHGVIKMLTSPYGFKTLVLAGVSSSGTAGVAAFFSEAERMREAYRRIRAASPKGFPSDWEVLIEIAVHDGLPVGASVRATRPQLIGN